MGEDASLDDFLDSDDESPGDGPDTAADGDASPDEPTPATTTYAWSDEGTACAACGETVERRWHQGGALVCVDCKVWSES